MANAPIKTVPTMTVRRITMLVVAILIIACDATAKPDLTVSRITMTREIGGIYVETVSVTVTNACADAASASHLQITFKKDSQTGSDTIYYVVGAVRGFRGRESQTLTFNVLEKKVVFGRYVIAEVDVYKKVDEVREDNNRSTRYPDETANPATRSECLHT